MALDKSDVENIAHLARLAVDEADIPQYAENLSSILGLVEQMNAVDTSGVEPMAHPFQLKNVLADDVPGEPLPVEEALANAPARRGDSFRVPRVVE